MLFQIDFPDSKSACRFNKRRNAHMKVIWILALSTFAGFLLPLRIQAQDKRFESATPTALEKQLYDLELKWMKAEHDKKLDGPDSMGEMWMDDFFDVLPTGVVVDKHEMMDMMNKADARPGTGAFPDTFKIRAIYGNVALATDHTTIKGVDANGNIVAVREMRVLRMFVKDKGKWRVAGAGLVVIPPK
jgi:ketosteroid isomerase-like protein